MQQITHEECPGNPEFRYACFTVGRLTVKSMYTAGDAEEQAEAERRSREKAERSLSFEGVDPYSLVHRLYQGTRALGLGALHDTRGLTVEQVREDLDARPEERRFDFDYYRGRPLKLKLDLESETFDPALYDRDAGRGAAAAVLAALRASLQRLTQRPRSCDCGTHEAEARADDGADLDSDREGAGGRRARSGRRADSGVRPAGLVPPRDAGRGRGRRLVSPELAQTFRRCVDEMEGRFGEAYTAAQAKAHLVDRWYRFAEFGVTGRADMSKISVTATQVRVAPRRSDPNAEPDARYCEMTVSVAGTAMENK